MAYFHQITVIGNLIRDMETRYSKDGLAIAKSALALQSGYGDRKKTLFLNFTLFGKAAEATANMKKGDPILVQGQLEENVWKDKDGKERKAIQINAQSFQFMGAKSGGSAVKKQPTQDTAVQEEAGPDYGDIPF